MIHGGGDWCEGDPRNFTLVVTGIDSRRRKRGGGLNFVQVRSEN